MYAKHFKRMFDFLLSLIALIALSPILIVLVVIGTVMMKGNPFFIQYRPGKKGKAGQEKIFKIIKLRTMTNDKDAMGELLPDSQRLTPYGKWLRSTSLDELFELISIIKGDMAIVGPRPLLVRDMTFMSKEQRRRHDVRPGLTGLAQVCGRNSISWESKLDLDLKYINHITLAGDIKIILQTISRVFKREGICEDGMDTAMDYGDYLLSKGEVDEKEYKEKQAEAEGLLRIII